MEPKVCEVVDSNATQDKINNNDQCEKQIDPNLIKNAVDRELKCAETKDENLLPETNGEENGIEDRVNPIESVHLLDEQNASLQKICEIINGCEENLRLMNEKTKEMEKTHLKLDDNDLKEVISTEIDKITSECSEFLNENLEHIEKVKNSLDADDAIKMAIKNIVDVLKAKSNEELPGVQVDTKPLEEPILEVTKPCVQEDLKPTINGSLEDTSKQAIQTKPSEGYISEMEWRCKETALLVRIAKLEEDERIKQEAFKIQLKNKCDENEMLKAKLKTLDVELRAVCGKPNAKNKDMVNKIKKQHDDLLTKARGMIFEKTKMISNQDLKIDALNAQVRSLKEIVDITKDMLNIRNMECQHLQDRMQTMELRLQAEKERQNFLEKRTENENRINKDLKAEYLKQLELFKAVKEKYEEKIAVLERNQKEPAETSNSNSQA